MHDYITCLILKYSFKIKKYKKFQSRHKNFKQNSSIAPQFNGPISTNKYLYERYLNTRQKTSKIHQLILKIKKL